MDEFEHQLNLVCETPELYGLSRMEELAALGYRAMHVKNYAALYKVGGGEVVIVHIVNGFQDYAKLV